MRGALYTLESEDIITRHVIEFADLPEGTEFTPALAYEHFKLLRKQFNIRGKRFNLLMGGCTFYIGKVVVRERKNGKIVSKRVFKTYKLGEEDGQDSLSDSVVAE